MKKYVYVVKCHYGQYEDRYDFIDSVWSDDKEAERRKKSIETYYRKMLIAPCPFDEDISPDELNKKDFKIYCEWEYEIDKATDFKFVEVLKFELDKAERLF